MKFKLCIIILFISNFILAQDTLDVLNASLTGKWNWDRTNVVSELGGGVDNSSRCHCTRHLLFKTNSVVELYENNKLKYSSDYSLREVYFLNDPVMIMFDSEFLRGQLILKNNTLGIGDFGLCGIECYYSKAE